MTDKKRKKYKIVTVYMTEEQAEQTDFLMLYYSKGAAVVGPSQLVRYATDRLYQAVRAGKEEV